MRRVVITSLVLAVAVEAFPLVASAQDQQKQELSENEAVELLRAVNTAEVDIKLMRKQPYAPLQQLLHHRPFVGTEVASNIAIVDSTTGRKKGYQISVDVLGEGKRYTASIVPIERHCRVAFFTDESGVIYKG
jgi:hypothetical protein